MLTTLVLLLAAFASGLIAGAALTHEHPGFLPAAVDFAGSLGFVVAFAYAVVVTVLLLWFLLLDFLRDLFTRRSRPAHPDSDPDALSDPPVSPAG